VHAVVVPLFIHLRAAANLGSRGTVLRLDWIPSTMPASDIAHEFDSIEDTIEAFKKGEFIVVLDDLDRENEGDLILAAADMTPEKMAFMVRYTSGLICAPITPSLTQSLDLPQMVLNSQDPKRTAYTVSIDAEASETTTGISAHDRALTCRTLASKTATKHSFRRPGHLLPLRAREGGISERAGHTEAAVEFCKLAGKPHVGVIGELVEDGVSVAGQAIIRESGMMRRDGCLAFGKKWGLKVCTIEDLVTYVGRSKGKMAEQTNGIDKSAITH